MLRDHRVELRHDHLVRNHLATICRIDADLHEGLEIGFAFGDTADGFRREDLRADTTRLGQSVDQRSGGFVEVGRYRS
ncbi:hypothetical protein [Sphingomonas sp. UYP23]